MYSENHSRKKYSNVFFFNDNDDKQHFKKMIKIYVWAGVGFEWRKKKVF